MISPHFFTCLAMTSLWRFGGGFRGPHHPTVGHQHYHPEPSWQKKIIKDKEMLHDQRHIAEDLDQSEHFQEEKLSSAEMEFRYFKVHDVDNNYHLDGIEMYHAIKHHLEMSSDKPEDSEWAEKEKRVVKLIDEVLEEYDTNSDGYINYREFTAGRQKENIGKDEI